MSIPLRQPLAMMWVWQEGTVEFMPDAAAQLVAEAVNVRGLTQLIAKENPLQFECRGNELASHDVTAKRVWTFGATGQLLEAVTR